MTSKRSVTNTHFYDRKISLELLEQVNQLTETGNKISKSEKLECFDVLRSDLVRNKIKRVGLRYYDAMVKSYNKSNKNNYDSINKLDCIDLLYIIYTLSNDSDDIILLLKDQLTDMRTGFCPQGRTIRLIQIIATVLE